MLTENKFTLYAGALLLGMAVAMGVRKLFRKPKDHLSYSAVSITDGEAKYSAYYSDATVEVTVEGWDSYEEAQEMLWKTVRLCV